MNAEGTEAATVEVVVQLSPTASRGGPQHQALLACAAGFGIGLQPLVASASGSALDTYHVGQVAVARAADAVERLRQCDGVDAAYTKARGQPPQE